MLTPHGFELRELGRPSFGPGELLIQTIACGVCSGDLFLYHNRHPLAAAHPWLGHEASGRVVDAGREVTGFSEGDRVTSLSSPAFADYLVATPDELVKLPPEIDPVYALGEPLACCVHAVNRLDIVRGDRIAVVGCGFMGLVSLQLAKHLGASFLCALDPLDDRRSMSRQLGADMALDPKTTSAGDILEQCGEFDLVIEAAGVQSALDLCGDLVREHGRLLLVGYHQSNGGRRTVNMQQWNYKALDVINGHVRRQDEKLEAMHQGMDWMRQGHLITAPLVTPYDLADIDQAFRDLVAGKPGLIKAVLLIGKRAVDPPRIV
jgi:threonine dehydrogenase-like Zn-dependent dehydrogenase